MQFFQSRSKGSPNAFSSLSKGVFDVLKTIAVLALNKPFGTPSPCCFAEIHTRYPGERHDRPSLSVWQAVVPTNLDEQ